MGCVRKDLSVSSSAKRTLLVRAREGSEGQHRPGLFPHDPVQLHTAGQGLVVSDHHLQGLPYLCFVWCSAVSPPYPFLSQPGPHATSGLQGLSCAIPSPCVECKASVSTVAKNRLPCAQCSWVGGRLHM